MTTSEIIKFIAINILIPVVVSIVVFHLKEKSTDRKRRLTNCRIGVLIFESFREEVETGIGIMERAFEYALDENCPQPYLMSLPRKSWTGIDSIPVESLLIIRENESFVSSGDLHPRDCRNHIKNYFVNICANTDQALHDSYLHHGKGEDWRTRIVSFIKQPDDNNHLECAKKVRLMIDDCIKILKVDAKWR